jgi:hypothetical protein
LVTAIPGFSISIIVYRLFGRDNGNIGLAKPEFRKYNIRMETNRPVGRPARDPGGEASKLFPVRLTASERAQYGRAAKRAKMTISEWMRDRLTKAAKRESKRD